MIFREALPQDYFGMHKVRMAVKENILSNPDLITRNEYEEMVTSKGKGWVCETEGIIIGFSIIDISTQNIWALFVDPKHEKQGIGKKLFDMMMAWGFDQHVDSFWLSTSPHSRAEQFYRTAGWRTIGITSTGEIKFEMTKDEYRLLNK